MLAVNLCSRPFLLVLHVNDASLGDSLADQAVLPVSAGIDLQGEQEEHRRMDVPEALGKAAMLDDIRTGPACLARPTCVLDTRRLFQPSN
jgi:hypothetical protein